MSIHTTFQPGDLVWVRTTSSIFRGKVSKIVAEHGIGMEQPRVFYMVDFVKEREGTDRQTTQSFPGDQLAPIGFDYMFQDLVGKYVEALSDYYQTSSALLPSLEASA